MITHPLGPAGTRPLPWSPANVSGLSGTFWANFLLWSWLGSKILKDLMLLGKYTFEPCHVASFLVWTDLTSSEFGSPLDVNKNNTILLAFCLSMKSSSFQWPIVLVLAQMEPTGEFQYNYQNYGPYGWNNQIKIVHLGPYAGEFQYKAVRLRVTVIPSTEQQVSYLGVQGPEKTRSFFLRRQLQGKHVILLWRTWHSTCGM